MIEPAAWRILENVKKVIVGKDEVIRLLLVAVLCEGHVLLEDVPGTGKTTLARALATSLGCTFRRIQFTPDLLPSDVTGLSWFNQKAQEFEYRPGPLMSQVVLADEINRATPRTPSITPLEFTPRLLGLFPENRAELDEITGAYVRVRYGEYPETMAEVESVQAAWERVKKQGRGIMAKRGKKKPGG